MGSGHLDTVLLLHSLLWICKTRPYVVILNVPEVGAAGQKLVVCVHFSECVLPEMWHSSAFIVDGFLQKEEDLWHCIDMVQSRNDMALD